MQKEILSSKNYDISRFVSWTSHAFLPSTVYQLEEYGLPRMISRKIHNAGLINFTDSSLKIHDTIDKFRSIGEDTILKSVELDEFDKYILHYFFEGITINDY